MTLNLATRGYLGSGSGGSLENGTIISITNGELSRWTPIVAVLSATDSLIMIVMEVGDHRFAIYDESKAEGEQWIQAYGDRSLKALNDDDTINVSILPNGGWARKDFTLKFIAMNEFVLEELPALEM